MILEIENRKTRNETGSNNNSRVRFVFREDGSGLEVIDGKGESVITYAVRGAKLQVDLEGDYLYSRGLFDQKGSGFWVDIYRNGTQYQAIARYPEGNTHIMLVSEVADFGPNMYRSICSVQDNLIRCLENEGAYLK